MKVRISKRTSVDCPDAVPVQVLVRDEARGHVKPTQVMIGLRWERDEHGNAVVSSREVVPVDD